MRAFPPSLSVAFCITASAYADSGDVWIFTDGRGAMPVNSELISMEAESVSIVPVADELDYSSADMKVNCVFYLRNLTDGPLDESVFFPFESFYDPVWQGNNVRRNSSRSVFFYSRAVEEMGSAGALSVQGEEIVPEWLQFRAFTDEEEYDVYYLRGVVNEDMRLVFWPVMACWDMHFEPGETIRLENSYYTGWNYDHYWEWVSSFTYITRSGATWAGTIGDAVISLTVPDYYSPDGTDYCCWNWNGSPVIHGNTLTWHYTDWEPEEDITFTAYGSPARINVLDFAYGHPLVASLMARWRPGTLYPEVLKIFSATGDVLSAETTADYLERWGDVLCGRVSKDSLGYFDKWFIRVGPLDDLSIMATVDQLNDHLSYCRSTMESGGMDFLLQLAILEKDWSHVNMGMYCAHPRQQTAYLIFLENLRDAVMGQPVIDPAVESLFWLTGWYIPDEVSPMLDRFITDWHDDGTREIVSRSEVDDRWIQGECGIPLVRSESVREASFHPCEVQIESSGNVCGDLMDGDTETFWLTGSDGYGYGESISVSVTDQEAVRCFSMVNGCGQSASNGKEYSRVRKLFICLNGTPLMVAELSDTPEIQTVDFPGALNLDPEDRLSFEIVEVYPGLTFPGTAVSELSLGIQD